MKTPIILQEVRGPVRTLELAFSHTSGQDMIVWWYGGIRKNVQAASVPLVAVFFRVLDSAGLPRSFVRHHIALTHLGLMRIGSVWREGVCRAQSQLAAETFAVDFSEGAWRLVSPGDHRARIGASLIDPADYELRHRDDRNWLIAFPLASSTYRWLYVPCTEFLVRCFGRSAEVGRVLTTYPWPESQLRLLRAHLARPSPGYWAVAPGPRLRDEDAVFLAHLRHDAYTQRVSKALYAQTETAGPNAYAFLRVAPWFQGPAKLRCEGLRINMGEDFLCLRITGSSEPSGLPILIHRTAAPDPDLEPPQPGATEPSVIRRPAHGPHRYDLTSDEEPDHLTTVAQVEEPEYEHIGPRRSVSTVRQDGGNKARSPAPSPDGDPTRYSTGDAQGGPKGVGAATVHTPVVLESHGALRDVWTAMLHLLKRFPDWIESVEWFTFQDGFMQGTDPSLITLEPFELDTEVPSDVRRWVYLDGKKSVPGEYWWPGCGLRKPPCTSLRFSAVPKSSPTHPDLCRTRKRHSKGWCMQ